MVEACRRLKALEYTIALDGFVIKDEIFRYAPILKYVDIIKVEFSFKTINDQINLINKYKGKITFLADKIETRQDHTLALKMGYGLFQGFFFCKPNEMNTKTIGSFSNNLVLILHELAQLELDYDKIAAIFERDLGLSYRLLRLVNSVYYGVRYHIESLHHAAIQLGAKKLSQWVHLLLLKGLDAPENAELVKASIIRGKMLSMIAILYDEKENESEYFIAGIFSSIDVLLGRGMDDVLQELPLEDFVKEALLGGDCKLRKVIDVVLCLEKGYWDSVDGLLAKLGIPFETFMSIYKESIKWQQALK